jgi:hypothetical protein
MFKNRGVTARMEEDVCKNVLQRADWHSLGHFCKCMNFFQNKNLQFFYIHNWHGVAYLSMLGGSLVTTAWRVLRLRMEETPSVWRVTASMLNKQSRTADKGWFSSLGVGLGANNTSP